VDIRCFLLGEVDSMSVFIIKDEVQSRLSLRKLFVGVIMPAALLRLIDPWLMICAAVGLMCCH